MYRAAAPRPNEISCRLSRSDDPSLKIVATLRGVGKQVYDCTGGKYVFREPVAGLFGPRGLPAGFTA